MLDRLLYRWGVPPVVIRCVHWTMQMWVLQTWIKAQSLPIVMYETYKPTIRNRKFQAKGTHNDTQSQNNAHPKKKKQSYRLWWGASDQRTISFSTRFPKSGPTYRRQEVNQWQQTLQRQQVHNQAPAFYRAHWLAKATWHVQNMWC